MKRKLLKSLLAIALLCVGSASAWAETIATMGSTSAGWGDKNHAYTVAPNKTLKLTFTISETAGGDYDGQYVNITQDGDKIGIQPGGGFYYMDDGWGSENHMDNTANVLTNYKTVLPGSNVTITVRRFGTQLDYFADIRKGDTRLYRRLLTKANTFTENSNVTVVLGADHAVLTSITDEIFDESVKGTLLGQENNAGGFGQGTRKDYTIVPNGSLTLHFRNYSNEINKYNNWAFEMDYDSKYADIVSGGGSWGALLTDANLSYDESTWPAGNDWDFMDAYNGADVVLTITREGAKVSATAVHTAVDGETWTVKYAFTPTVEGFEDANANFRLLTEGGHIDLVPAASLSVPSAFELNTTSSINPFSDGAFTVGTKVTALNVNNTTATAWFDGDASTAWVQPYTLSENETVTASFTAFHGWLGSGAEQGVKIINSEGYTLAEYKYSLGNCNITDVRIGGETASAFTGAYNCQSSQYSNVNKGNANGFTGHSYLATDGYNPVITFTIGYDGYVTLNIVQTQRGINNMYTGYLPTGWAVDLQKLQVYSGSNNSDRTIGINNLQITKAVEEKYNVTFTYVDAENNSLSTYKANSVVQSLAGTEISDMVTSALTESFYNDDASVRYDYAGEYTVTDDATSVPNKDITVTLKFNAKAKYTCTVNAKAGDIVLATPSSSVYSGESATVYYQKAYANAGKWYFIDRNAATPGYGVDFKSVTSDQEQAVTTYALKANVVYFAEAENLSISGSWAADGVYPTWRSNGMAKRLSTNSYVYTETIAPGDYDVTLWVRNNRSAGEGTETIALYLRDENGVLTDLETSFPGWARGGAEAANTASVTIPDDGNTYAIVIYNNTGYNSNLEMDYVYVEKKNVSVTLGNLGWATLYTPHALDFSGVTGLTAYTAELSGNTITLTEVNNVPANTGVVLNGTAGSYNIPTTASSDTDPGDLRGNATEDTAYDAVTGQTIYVLATSEDDSYKVQFRPVKSGSVAAGKAYLPVASTAVKAFNVVFNDATGIHAMENETSAIENAPIFNLAGQRMSQLKRGVNIVNGKKVLVK